MNNNNNDDKSRPISHSLTSKMASIIVLADLAPLYHFIIAWA